MLTFLNIYICLSICAKYILFIPSRKPREGTKRLLAEMKQNVCRYTSMELVATVGVKESSEAFLYGKHKKYPTWYPFLLRPTEWAPLSQTHPRAFTKETSHNLFWNLHTEESGNKVFLDLSYLTLVELWLLQLHT